MLVLYDTVTSPFSTLFEVHPYSQQEFLSDLTFRLNRQTHKAPATRNRAIGINFLTVTSICFSPIHKF